MNAPEIWIALLRLVVGAWFINRIAEITADGIQLRQPEGQLTVKNPVRQARD